MIKVTESESRAVAAGDGESSFKDYKFQFCNLNRILEIDCTRVNVLIATELYPEKWLRW